MNLLRTCLLTGLLLGPAALAQGWVIDHTCTDPGVVPDSAIQQAKSQIRVAYNHTSHGSQLVSGMECLRGYPAFGDRYDYSSNGSATELEFHDSGIPGIADLSQGDYIDGNGVTPWVTSTRAYLDNAANLNINTVMWSWCSINGHDIPRYLDNMEILVSEYGPGGSEPRAATHPVNFVFMTGHAEGQGEDGFIHAANQQIREHCAANGRVLFDFADIESFDPDGNYFLDLFMYDNLDYSGGNWAVQWIAANPANELALLTMGGVPGYSGCTYCAHSDSPDQAALNCILKGRATWWMFARLAGWQPGGVTPTANIALLDAATVRITWDLLVPGQIYSVHELAEDGSWNVIASFPAEAASMSTDLELAADAQGFYRIQLLQPE